MEILHVSAECYPVAKAGGLGDVVGALPKYLNKLGHIAKVVMPMYRTKFLYENKWEVVHKGYMVTMMIRNDSLLFRLRYWIGSTNGNIIPMLSMFMIITPVSFLS